MKNTVKQHITRTSASVASLSLVMAILLTTSPIRAEVLPTIELSVLVLSVANLNIHSEEELRLVIRVSNNQPENDTDFHFTPTVGTLKIGGIPVDTRDCLVEYIATAAEGDTFAVNCPIQAGIFDTFGQGTYYLDIKFNARNPKTGEEITIKAARIPSFAPVTGANFLQVTGGL